MVGVAAVEVTVTVPSDVRVAVGVLEGRGVFVVVAGRLGVADGTAVVDWIVTVGVDVAAGTAGAFAGTPAPIKMIMIPAKSRSEIPLTKIPETVGRSRNAKRVNRPSVLASAKWTTKTRMPCGQMPSTPEPRPNPPALMGR
jgi:hypothetical protein